MEESGQHISESLQPTSEVQPVQDNKVNDSYKATSGRPELRTQTTIIPLEGKKSHAIQVLNSKEELFMIPVIDATDDEDARLTVEQMNRDANRARGSKFMRNSASLIGRSYQESWKKTKK